MFPIAETTDENVGTHLKVMLVDACTIFILTIKNIQVISDLYLRNWDSEMLEKNVTHKLTIMLNNESIIGNVLIFKFIKIL